MRAREEPLDSTRRRGDEHPESPLPMRKACESILPLCTGKTGMRLVSRMRRDKAQRMCLQPSQRTKSRRQHKGREAIMTPKIKMPTTFPANVA